jgi:putative ABC transport system permease protein
MNALREELAWALRSLWKTPGFTGLVVLILGLGIGANSAIFSLVDHALLRPLPYPHPERLVAVWQCRPEKGWLRQGFAGADFADWCRESTQLEGMAALSTRSMNLSGSAEPQELCAGRVSWNFFQVVGVYPRLGRGFLPPEDVADGPRVAVLSHGLWARRFGSDPGMVGRSLRLDGEDWLVVGIMPRGFQFDHQLRQCDLYVPLALERRLRTDRGAHFLSAVGRLRPGATAASAQAELEGVAARLAQAFPESNRGVTARVYPLQEELTRDHRHTLLLLMGAVALVLLIACANVMNLMLARSSRRERDTAIRAALGATRWRLACQGLLESALLGLAGGAAGLMLANFTLAGFRASLGLQGPEARSGLADFRVLAFALLLALATALAAGLVPAFQHQDRRLGQALKEGSRGTGGRAQHRLRGLLVALEMAIATALLVGSGLMLRSLWHLHALDPGFRSERVLVAQVGVPAFRYPTGESRITYTRNLLRRVADLPGVQAVGASDTLPMGGSTTGSVYSVEGLVLDDPVALDHRVSPGYFQAMGIPFLRGGDFSPSSEATAIVNESFARRHWADGDALGRRISVEGSGGPWKTILGVVGDVRQEALNAPPEPEIYFSMLELPPVHAPLSGFSLVLRTAGRPQSWIPALKQALRESDPELPVGNPRTMDELVRRSGRETRSRSALLTGFALLALGLAGAGIYGVISFITAGRTREIGVRMALGARPEDVLGLVLGQGLRMILLGLVLGLGAALALGRVLESLLVGVEPRDPATLVAAAGVLLAVGVLACLGPALRAARVPPATALRDE